MASPFSIRDWRSCPDNLTLRRRRLLDASRPGGLALVDERLHALERRRRPSCCTPSSGRRPRRPPRRRARAGGRRAPCRARSRRAAWRRSPATSDSTSASSASAATTRLTRPLARASSAEMKSPVTSISNAALRADVARQRDARRRAEEAEVDAAHREARAVGGDGEVAGGDELAAGRGGDALDARDHRHRQALDRQHHARALREQRLVVGLRRLGAHLLQVVAGAERLAARRR